MKKLLIPLLLLSIGCGVNHQIAKQHEYNYKYPNETAKDCAKLFPAKDSVGISVHKPAVNVDYSKQIDSLKQAADAYKAQLTALSNLPNDTATLKRKLLLQQSYITNQANQIDALKRSYKPCKPDTVYVAHYITDMAKLRVLQDQLQAKQDTLTKTRTLLAVSEKSESAWRWFGIAVISLAGIWLVTKVVIFFYGGWVKNLINKVKS